MNTYSVDILNPKAVRLLEDLADLQLIAIRKTQPVLSEHELTERKKAAREAVMQGSPTMDIDAMLAHIKESRQDRPLPFRDVE